MNWWQVANTPLTKEAQAARSLTLEGYTTFIPMSVTDKAVSRNTPARRLIHTILIPRVVFVLAPLNFSTHGLRHVKELRRNAAGEVLRISPLQMAQFQETHSEWLETQTKLYRAYINGLARKGKKPEVIKPSVDGWVEAMKKLGNTLFGEDLAA